MGFIFDKWRFHLVIQIRRGREIFLAFGGHLLYSDDAI